MNYIINKILKKEPLIYLCGIKQNGFKRDSMVVWVTEDSLRVSECIIPVYKLNESQLADLIINLLNDESLRILIKEYISKYDADLLQLEDRVSYVSKIKEKLYSHYTLI